MQDVTTKILLLLVPFFFAILLMFSFVLSRTDELRHIFAPKASYFFDTSVLQKFVLGSLSVREEHLHFKDFIGFSSIQQNLL